MSDQYCEAQDIPPEPFEVWSYSFSRDESCWRRHTRASAVDEVVVNALFRLHQKANSNCDGLLRLESGESTFRARLLPSIAAVGLAAAEIAEIHDEWRRFRLRPMRPAQGSA